MKWTNAAGIGARDFLNIFFVKTGNHVILLKLVEKKQPF
jgi:hypothetical protein